MDRSSKALRDAALAVSSAGGTDVFGELARLLAGTLGVEAVMISVFAEGDRSRMRTLATWLDGRLLKGFEYELAHSPCAGVVGREFRYSGSKASEEFAPGTLFHAKGFDSYSAYSLNDSASAQLGLIAVMSRGALPERGVTEATLKIFALRTAAELERLRSEESYRAIFEASEDAIFVHDWDSGAILEANAKAAESYGYSIEELRRATVDTLSAPDPAYSAERAMALIAQAKAQAEPLRFEWRGRHRDGHLMWHDVTLKAATLAGRRRLLAFVRDTTTRKAGEEALAASEAQYRAIFNASADALILWNSKLERVDVNPAYERIYGYRREEVIGRGYERAMPPEYVEQRLALVRRSLAGETCRVELEAIRKSGERFTVEATTIPITHRGEPHVLAIARDITERKAAEQALRASEEQYRAIFNASADALALRDHEFRIVDVNAAYEAVAGRRRADAIGQLGLTISNDPGVDRLALHARALAGEPVRIETEGQRPDGTHLVLEVRGVPVTYRGKPHVLYIGRDITARKAAEQGLRASEQQYRAIFNAASDAMVLWDSQLRRVDVNAAYERLFGWNREEVIGHSRLNSGTTAEYAERRLELVRRALAGESGHAELEAVRRSGETVLVEATAIPFMHGGERHVLVTLRDVTERRRAEAALRASEEQYRAIFNASADSLVLRDADFRVVDVNPAYERISGRPRREAIGMNTLTMSPPELTAHVRVLHGRALAGEHVQFEARARRKNGERFEIETRGVPILHQGKPHVLYIGRDITARKTEEELLRASEEQYRAIFNAAADALVLRDAQFRIVDVNPAYERMSGYGRAEVLGKDHVVANPPETDAEIKALHRRALAGEPIMMETVRVRKDGTRHDVELRGVAIRHKGEPHVLYIGRDLSERKALESRLRQAQKMEALGQLTGGIAHDFNNLLTTIMGYVALAAERAGAADPKLAAHLEQALASSRRARDLIQQMLTFSRGQRGTPRAVSLAETVEQSLKLMRGSLPSTLELEAASQAAPAVMVDPLQVEQVLMNLLINARDATAGIGRIDVAVGPARLAAKAVCASCRKRFKGPFVELSVADSGSGIAPQALERIFEPFYTTKEVGRGSGMGLAMVHGIVHDHSGHIIVESRPREGSRFRIFLPALASEAPAQAQPAEPAARTGRAPLNGRILVVDDEESVGRFMGELLESWGLAATVLTRPYGVIERLSRAPDAFDLAILDQTMPGITGMNLAREIASVRPGLPVILYTGHSERIRPGDLEAAGIRALLHKPVEPDLLYGLLKTHLR
ncbi:MAG TPA: PAS domain S-box protein [Burkholderiales bacterium]|nr:PAS domain S-box protein [Burkholderiales bacterium]